MKPQKLFYTIITNFFFFKNIETSLDVTKIKVPQDNGKDHKLNFNSKSVPIDLKINNHGCIHKMPKSKLCLRKSAATVNLRHLKLNSKKDDYSQFYNDDSLSSNYSNTETTDKSGKDSDRDQSNYMKSMTGEDLEEFESSEKQKITVEVNRRCLLLGSLMLSDYLSMKNQIINEPVVSNSEEKLDYMDYI